jgi:F-box and WD-40 domain protein 1/11
MSLASIFGGGGGGGGGSAAASSDALRPAAVGFAVGAAAGSQHSRLSSVDAGSPLVLPNEPRLGGAVADSAEASADTSARYSANFSAAAPRVMQHGASMETGLYGEEQAEGDVSGPEDNRDEFVASRSAAASAQLAASVVSTWPPLPQSSVDAMLAPRLQELFLNQEIVPLEEDQWFFRTALPASADAAAHHAGALAPENFTATVQRLNLDANTVDLTPRARPSIVSVTRESLNPRLQALAEELRSLSAGDRSAVLGLVCHGLSRSAISRMSQALHLVTSRDFVSYLPLDLTLRIFLMCEPEDLWNSFTVCRLWFVTLCNDALWEYFVLKHGMPKRLHMHLPLQFKMNRWSGPKSMRKLMAMQRVDIVAARTWEAGTFQISRRIRCDSNGVYSVHFDEHSIVTGHRDHKGRVWDFQPLRGACEQQPRVELVGHKGSVLSIFLHRHMIVTGSSDSRIRLWRRVNGVCTQELEGHELAVLQVTMNDAYIVSASKDHTVRVWQRTSTGYHASLLHVLRDHTAAVNAVEFQDDIAVSVSGDRHMSVWSVSEGRRLQKLSAHDRGVSCLHFHDGYAATGSSDHHVRVRDGDCV